MPNIQPKAAEWYRQWEVSQARRKLYDITSPEFAKIPRFPRDVVGEQREWLASQGIHATPQQVWEARLEIKAERDAAKMAAKEAALNLAFQRFLAIATGEPKNYRKRLNYVQRHCMPVGKLDQFVIN